MGTRGETRRVASLQLDTLHYGAHTTATRLYVIAVSLRSCPHWLAAVGVGGRRRRRLVHRLSWRAWRFDAQLQLRALRLLGLLGGSAACEAGELAMLPPLPYWATKLMLAWPYPVLPGEEESSAGYCHGE